MSGCQQCDGHCFQPEVCGRQDLLCTCCGKPEGECVYDLSDEEHAAWQDTREGMNR